MVLQQDFDERRAAALEITTMRSFKHEPFFCGGGGGLVNVLHGTTGVVVYIVPPYIVPPDNIA